MGLIQRRFIDDDGQDDFWWTRTGQIVRWAIFFGIFFLIFSYFIFGRMHANRRLRKGLSPLAYHRWLLSRHQRAIHEPRFRDPAPNYSTYRPQEYGMSTFAPPVYDPNSAPPPTYAPPQGATKIDPSQWRSEPTRRPADDYAAPEGPPPAFLRPERPGQASGTTNP